MATEQTEELITAAEAAAILGIHPKVVYNLEKMGFIAGQRRPHTKPALFLRRSSVEEYRQARDARKQVRIERGRPLTNAERCRALRERKKLRALAAQN